MRFHVILSCSILCYILSLVVWCAARVISVYDTRQIVMHWMHNSGCVVRLKNAIGSAAMCCTYDTVRCRTIIFIMLYAAHVMWCRLFPHLHGFPLFYVGVVFVQERDKKRGSQIVTGDRSEIIRTYNYPQGRVTDHRAGISKHSIEKMLEGVYLSELVRMNLLHEKCGFRHLHRI